MIAAARDLATADGQQWDNLPEAAQEFYLSRVLAECVATAHYESDQNYPSKTNEHHAGIDIVAAELSNVLSANNQGFDTGAFQEACEDPDNRGGY
jgi:hypothetical protein